MERLLVYQHVPHEHPGRFTDIAQDQGIQVDIIKLWEGQKIPDLGKYSRLLVMGGPQSVYDSLEQYPSRDAEIDSIRIFAQTGKPVLGVCLGSQLISHAFGGKVYPNIVNGQPFKETGFYRVQLTADGQSNPLFRGFPESYDVFQWHGDVFELPVGAKLLATGQNVRNQAFAYGNSIYGTLFHVEITPQIIEELIRVDWEWLHKNNDADERTIIEQAYRNEQTLSELGEKLFSNWLNL
jgi:GMP synthase (glutamine-hydrolysing)